MRQQYETKEDLENEKQGALFLSKKWDSEFIKLKKIPWVLDFLIKKGDRYAWAEVKCLNMKFGRFPFMISQKKIMAARRLSMTSGKDFFLIFRCTDTLCYHKWDFSKDYKFEYGGRTTQTRDEEDIEPILRVYPEQCVKVKGFWDDR